MAKTKAEKAEDRTADTVGAIRELLRNGDTLAALHKAVGQTTSEAAKRIRGRPRGDGDLLAAQLAGLLAGWFTSLYQAAPERPPGCPRHGPPRPIDLLAMFESARTARPPEED